MEKRMREREIERDMHPNSCGAMLNLSKLSWTPLQTDTFSYFVSQMINYLNEAKIPIGCFDNYM